MGNVGMMVRATEEVTEGDELFARPGAVGTAVNVERFEDGIVAVVVEWPGAGRLTTCYLGEDCEWVVRA
jgi:hypothetical protein